MNTKHTLATAFAMLLAAACLMGLAVGCDDRPPASVATPANNPAYQVDSLFTDADGYTVKRFRDRDEYRYYVVGPANARTEWSITRQGSDDGKGNCTTTTDHYSVPTVRR